MQKNPGARVSVALCTHNGGRYVLEQVRSILDQTRTPDEIIVSDDDSTDDTLDLIRAEFERTPELGVRLHVIRNSPALGVVKNFEGAIAACSGDLIVLCDQDDVWHPERIERMLDRFEHSPDVLLMNSDARLVDGDGEILGETLFDAIGVTGHDLAAFSEGEALAVLLRRNIITGATVMLRRQVFDRAYPFPAEWVHDEWLAIVGAVIGRLETLPEQLLDYRQHGANQIGAKSLTLWGKLGKLREPRTERNALVAARADVLLARLDSIDRKVTDSVRHAVSMKAEHERARASLPESRWRRPAPVLREVRTGRYRSCGRGIPDIVRDLVQPV